MKRSLVPPDFERCQTEITERPGPFQLGGGPRTYRCPNKPTVIATEKRRDAHGRQGSMSLCPTCLAKFKEQMLPDSATFKTIPTKRTVYFAMTINKQHVLVLLTEDEPGYKPVKGAGVFDSWEAARDVALARNKYEKHLSFAASDSILASVLLARTRAGLVEAGKGWMCAGKPAHYNPIFRNTCEVCGAAPFVRIPKGTRRKKGGAPRRE